MSEAIFQITAPHYCAGLAVEDGRVVWAAPILKWTKGKTWRKTKQYFDERGYTVHLLDGSRWKPELVKQP